MDPAFRESSFHALVTRLLTGLDCPFVVWRPSELREALERRADELSAMARRQETGHTW